MSRNQGPKARFGVFVKCHFGNRATVFLLLRRLRCKITTTTTTTITVVFISRIRVNKWWGDQVLLILLMFLLWLSLCFPLEGDSGLILQLSSFSLVSLLFFLLWFFKKFFWWFDRYEMWFLVLLFWFFFYLGIRDTFIRNEILCCGTWWSWSGFYYYLYLFFLFFFLMRH